MNNIRKVIKSDLEGLKHVLDTIELFPAEMLDDMISDYFENPVSEEIRKQRSEIFGRKGMIR